jgi:hypothetical protein
VTRRPRFDHRDAEFRGGVDSKFVLHDNLVLDVTANPDFSQVESDEPQITVNQRFEVFFPERRPFFLENSDYFKTPIDLFFTRRIGDPQFGARLTGKVGPYSMGILAADDRGPGNQVPDNDPLAGDRSTFAIARLNRDIFGQSSVGAIYTDWEFPAADAFNRVGGIDSRLKFNPNWTGNFQAVASSTRIRMEAIKLDLPTRPKRTTARLTSTTTPLPQRRQSGFHHQCRIREPCGHPRDWQQPGLPFLA